MMNRTDRILALFQERPRWMVAELCAKTGYAESTVHGALSELSEHVTSVQSEIPRQGSGRRPRIYWLAQGDPPR